MPLQRKTRRREPLRAQLFFDLACPFTYLAIERVERAFSHVTWTATSSETLQRRCLADDPEGADRVRAAAERRAAQLRLPLVWPEHFPREVPAAMRAAAYAAEQGRGGEFVLAAGRLAFAAASTSTTRRSSPRRRLPPASRSRTACTPRATSGATAWRRRSAAGCWRREPTGCRCCASAARCSGASSASAPRRRRCVRQPRRSRAGASSESLRADETREDLRVHRVDRVGTLGVVLDRREGRPRVVGLVEQQVEIRVRRVAARE